MSPKPWFNPTCARAENEVVQAMQTAFQEAQSNG